MARSKEETKELLKQAVSKGISLHEASKMIGILPKTALHYKYTDAVFSKELLDLTTQIFYDTMDTIEASRDWNKDNLMEIILSESTSQRDRLTALAQHAKLLGLNMPDRVQVDNKVSYTDAALDEINSIIDSEL